MAKLAHQARTNSLLLPQRLRQRIIALGAELLFYEIRLRSLRVQASLLPLAGTNFAPFVGTKGEKEICLMRKYQIISIENFTARHITHGNQTCIMPSAAELARSECLSVVFIYKLATLVVRNPREAIWFIARPPAVEALNCSSLGGAGLRFRKTEEVLCVP